MEDQFVPYELALKLKELGFDEHCFGARGINNTILSLGKYESQVSASLDNKILTPLWQQAFDWFRGTHIIVHTIYSNASGYIWELHYTSERGGTSICNSGETGDCEYSGMFTTYEAARLECLKKLIELVENKNE